MRTKTLLLTAALCAAGAASSMAQVYSVNIVGYANVPLKGSGALTLVANPFNDGNGNQLTNLLNSSLPKNSAVLTWAGATFSAINKGASAWLGNTSLPPGVGFFVRNGAVGSSVPDLTNTFVGSVVVNVGASVTNSVQLNLGPGTANLFGSPIPYTGDLVTVGTASGSTNLNLGQIITAKNSQILTWKNNGPTYTAANRGAATWLQSSTIGVGEGFFVNNKNASATNWVQTLWP